MYILNFHLQYFYGLGEGGVENYTIRLNSAQLSLSWGLENVSQFSRHFMESQTLLLFFLHPIRNQKLFRPIFSPLRSIWNKFEVFYFGSHLFKFTHFFL